MMKKVHYKKVHYKKSLRKTFFIKQIIIKNSVIKKLLIRHFDPQTKYSFTERSQYKMFPPINVFVTKISVLYNVQLCH